MTDVERLLTRRAELQRELAAVDEALVPALGEALGACSSPAEPPDEVLRLAAAAAFMGEKPAVFLRKPEYLKASLRRHGERLHRYSRRELERIMADRLAANGGS